MRLLPSGVHGKLGLIQRVNKNEIVYVPREEETFETDGADGDESQPDTVLPEEIDWADVDVTVMQDSSVKNILFIGQDARQGEGRSRSDTMIICSLNKKTGKIILTSVMRDMYVPIPGYSDNRINAALSAGRNGAAGSGHRRKPGHFH